MTMILVAPQFTPRLLPDKGKHRSLYCVGFSKVGLVYISDDKDSTGLSGRINRRCEFFDLYKELVPYKEAWSWQKSLVRRRHTLIDRDEDHSDMLIILQHPSVYTLGTRSLEKYLNFDIENAPHDIYRTERGGEVMYHGPGQMVMYPILNLRYHKMDLHWYLRSLEEVVIPPFNFFYQGIEDRGVHRSLGRRPKVAAIGIRVSRWIAYHGLALNVTTDQKPFGHIIPAAFVTVGSAFVLPSLPAFPRAEVGLRDGLFQRDFVKDVYNGDAMFSQFINL